MSALVIPDIICNFLLFMLEIRKSVEKIYSMNQYLAEKILSSSYIILKKTMAIYEPNSPRIIPTGHHLFFKDCSND